MNQRCLSRALAVIAFVLPSLSHARVRYTDAAACMASLTNVGRPIPESGGMEHLETVDLNARGAMPTLTHLRDLTRAHLAESDIPATKRGEYARIQADVERIVAAPNYQSDEGFAVTDVIQGRDAILDYAARMEARATDLTNATFDRLSARPFRLGRMLARSTVPLVAVGFYALLFQDLIQTPDLTWGHLGLLLGGSGVLGVVMGHEGTELFFRWRAYFNPTKRRQWMLLKGREVWSDHFDQIRRPLAAPEPRQSPAYLKIALETRLETADVRPVFEANAFTHAIDVLANAPRNEEIPPGESPAFSRVTIENILFIDPKSEEPYVVVHVHGVHQPNAAPRDSQTALD